MVHETQTSLCHLPPQSHHSSLPSAEPGLVTQAFRLPSHLKSSLSLTQTSLSPPSLSASPMSHPAPMDLSALSQADLEFTATSKSFAPLVSFTWGVFLSLLLLKENVIHYPRLSFLRNTLIQLVKMNITLFWTFIALY